MTTATARDTLSDLLLRDTSATTAAIREWLPAADRYTLTAEDLARIDSYGSTDGATLHAQLPLILPLERPVWYEAEVTAQRGTQMVMGYGATPAGPREIAVWFAAHARGTDHILGPLGPLRLDATAIDPEVDADSPVTRELRAAAGIVIRALLLDLGQGTTGRRPRGGTRSANLNIRITPDERSRWSRAAESEGRTLAEWIRAAAELAYARGGTR